MHKSDFGHHESDL